MADIPDPNGNPRAALGQPMQNMPEPRSPQPAVAPAYLAMMRRKRFYSLGFLALCVILLASGFQVAQERNAGDFLGGLHMLGAFPSEVLSEAWPIARTCRA